MTRFFLFGLIWSVSLVFSGCLGPYEAKLPKDPENEGQVSGFLAELSDLPPDEQKDIKDFVVRMREAKRIEGYGYITGTTAREALEKQRKWLKEEEEHKRFNKELDDKIKKEGEAKQLAGDEKRLEMLKICTVTLTKKKFKPSKKKRMSGDRFSMELKFDNKGKKDLVALMGKLEFQDTSGKMLKTIKIPLQEEIKAGKSMKWSGDLPCDKSKEKDVILAKIPLNKLKVNWLPEVYHFKDGTRMGIGI